MNAYVEWIVGKALPFWATDGFDARRARFRERLDLAGMPLDVPHRSTVQARQIYVFSQAALLGWHRDGGALAEAAMASLIERCCDETAGQASFAFSTDAAGAVVSDVRDAYAHAFILFALASLHRLNGDRRLLLLADKVTAFIDDKLLDPLNGGLFDAFPVAGREKRQNPLMHLLEAYLALERAAPGRGHIERAAGLVTVFKERLFQPGEAIIPEHFAEDWSGHPDPEMAGIVEPGHHFEWVWLLGDYERLSGDPAEAWAAPLYDVARRSGIAASGLIFDEIGSDRAPRKRSNRLWPHTEAIKAGVMRGRSGDVAALPFARSCADILLRSFLNEPFAGGWIDHRDEAGRPLVDYVPASSLYHLVFAATELAAAETVERKRTPAAEPLRASAA